MGIAGWQETDIFKEWEMGVPERHVPSMAHAFTRPLSPKEDFFHIKGLDERTLCGIDTLTALLQDEGGQWREATTAELSAKPCPRCMEIHSNDEAGSDQGFSGDQR